MREAMLYNTYNNNNNNNNNNNVKSKLAVCLGPVLTEIPV